MYTKDELMKVMNNDIVTLWYVSMILRRNQGHNIETEARHQKVEARPRQHFCCLEARLLPRDIHQWLRVAKGALSIRDYRISTFHFRFHVILSYVILYLMCKVRLCRNMLNVYMLNEYKFWNELATLFDHYTMLCHCVCSWMSFLWCRVSYIVRINVLDSWCQIVVGVPNWLPIQCNDNVGYWLLIQTIIIIIYAPCWHFIVESWEQWTD